MRFRYSGIIWSRRIDAGAIVHVGVGKRIVHIHIERTSIRSVVQVATTNNNRRP